MSSWGSDADACLFMLLVQVKGEVAVITSLTDDQIERWIRSLAAQAQLQNHSSRGLAVATSGSVWGSSSSVTSSQTAGRHATPRRRQPGAQASPVGPPTASRKRKAPGGGGGDSGAIPVAEKRPHTVRLPCYQLTTPENPSALNADSTVASRLLFIVDTLLQNELSLAFSAPVNVEDVPGYSSLIKHPMDLGTIKKRLQRGFYNGRVEQVRRDVELVWTNCFTFNRLDAEISKCANRLRCKYGSWCSAPCSNADGCALLTDSSHLRPAVRALDPADACQHARGPVAIRGAVPALRPGERERQHAALRQLRRRVPPFLSAATAGCHSPGQLVLPQVPAAAHDGPMSCVKLRLRGSKMPTRS
jgi:hypothetical protein